MTQHSEQFHIKRVFEDHITPLLNDHHANVAFYYYDRSLRKYIVHAGPRSKKRLEFLLENDALLKKAIKKDDDESNRCYQADFVENNLNTVRGRAPIARLKQKLKYLNVDELSNYLRIEVLNDHVATATAAGKKPKGKVFYGKKEFEAWWWKHVAHLLPWHLIPGLFKNIPNDQFNAIKGPGVTSLTECLREIIRIFLQVHKIDPDSHVIQDFDKETLNRKRRRRGKKFVRADSSTSGPSTSGSSTSGSSTSGSSTSGSSSSDSSGSSSLLSSYFSSQPIRPITGRSRSQITASVQHLLGTRTSHAASSASHPSSQPPLPATPQPPIPATPQPSLPSTLQPSLPSTLQPSLPSTSQPPLPSTPQPPLPSTPQPPLPSTSNPSQPSAPAPYANPIRTLPLILLNSTDSSLSDTLPTRPTPPSGPHPSSPLNMFNHTRSKDTISDQEFRTLCDAANQKKKRKTLCDAANQKKKRKT